MTGLTHFEYMGTVWPFAAWYACCYVFERNNPGLDRALFGYACREGIVFG